MGLDAAFIIIKPTEGDPNITAIALCNEHVIHDVVMRLTKPTAYDNKPPIFSVSPEHRDLVIGVDPEYGVESDSISQYYHCTDTYVELSDAHIAKLFSTHYFEIDTSTFSFDDDDEGSRFWITAALLQWFYPDMGDKLIYAWSD